MWISLGILSAFFLGIYDVMKKWSLRDNAVLKVLFLSNCFAVVITVPVFLLSLAMPRMMAAAGLLASFPTFAEHGYILLKTLLVSASWISAFFALKHLPISIVSPIRASAPLWTLLGAVFLFGESLRPMHWGAIVLIFSSYYVFSLLGRQEGIHFKKNRWVFLVAIATLTGAASALYDKYLLHNLGIDRITLQVWFSFYLVLVNGTIWWVSRFLAPGAQRFEWRYSIVFIGVFLIVADYLYFRSLSYDDALIAVLSVVRRSSVVVSFLVGGLLFKELNKRKKLIPLSGVLLGIILLVVS
ncbi:MAG: EamA family transporter [Deltaproteobacteria bacterium]|nr:EamA family transporter [Deltaproteobacteria bacterium]MBN2674180.1 EamA family transporter [Deltaproteobacteria bacterium]